MLHHWFKTVTSFFEFVNRQAGSGLHINSTAYFMDDKEFSNHGLRCTYVEFGVLTATFTADHHNLKEERTALEVGMRTTGLPVFNGQVTS